jgi:hypothetical protein
MNRSKLILVVGFLLVLAIIHFGRNPMGSRDDEFQQLDFEEVASVLWKARIYQAEIDFVSSERIFNTFHFGVGEKHVNSITYRSLNGYFDPVLVTVLRRNQAYRALIIDPKKEQPLFEVNAEAEIFVSISSDNKILLTYSIEKREATTAEDLVVAWPLRD